MNINAAIIQAAATGYQLLFDEGWELGRPVYPELAMSHTSVGREEHYIFGGGAPDIQEARGERQENNVINFETVILNREWVSDLKIPLADWLDDRLGRYQGDAREMGVRARNHPDDLLAELMLAGFDNPGYDAEAFFSDGHELMDGTTQSNLVEEALDADSFEEAYQKLRGMKNPRGRPIRAMSAGGKPKLVVGSALQSAAERIVKMQFDAAGASNANYGKADIIVHELLDSEPTAWFLAMTGGAKAPFIFQNRLAPKFSASTLDEGMVRKVREVCFDLYGRYNVGYGLHEYCVGGGITP